MIKALFSHLLLVLLCSVFATCASESNPEPNWPKARNSHSSAFNSDTGELLIFGGSTSAGEDNTFWSFKNGQWNLLSTEGPGKREDALLVYHTKNKKAYLIGGRNFTTNTTYQDFWEWNGTAWTRISEATPFGSLTHATATYDQENDRLLVFGGLSNSTNSLTSALWSWDGTAWDEIEHDGPGARLAASLIYSNQKVFLFGGSISNGTVFQEVWELNGMAWTKINEAMPALLSQVAVLEDKFILFGGFKSDRSVPTETWIFNNNAWTSSNLTPPSPRALHSLVYDPVNECVWMFGGGTGTGTMFDELWKYKDGTWSQQTK
jgi:hypothetical protein